MLHIENILLPFNFSPQLFFSRQIGQILRHEQVVVIVQDGISRDVLAGFSTQQNAKLLFNEDGTPTARTGKILNNTPMDRFGEVEELIGSVLFLACEEASGFVNGACIPIDGAFAAYSGV